MVVLSLDISTKTGWAVFLDRKLQEYGLLSVKVDGLNFKPDPSKSPKYPKNILNASSGLLVQVIELLEKYKPDVVVIENTVKGRNRHYQRCLEWFHKDIIDHLMSHEEPFIYLDPSEWRKILSIKLSKDDKKSNSLVSQGKKRGRITKKHLSLRQFEKEFGIKLKMKQNNEAEAALLGLAFIKRELNGELPT